MKLFVYITNAEQFLSDDEWSVATSIHVTTHDDMSEYNWYPLGTVDIDVESVDRDEVRAMAVNEIKKDKKTEQAQHEVKMQQFDERIQKLLALTYNPEVQNE